MTDRFPTLRIQYLYRPFKHLPLFFICLVLWGCQGQDSSTDLIEDYVERIERVLEADFSLPEQARPAVRYPEPKALKRDLPEFNINWLDFFSIMGCDLNRLVGERNSSLGKFMSASQRWRYEQEFLQLARQCIDHHQQLGTQADFMEELTSVLETKRQSIADVAWNATWAGPEFAELMSFHDGALTVNFSHEAHAELTAALATLSQWSEKPEQLQESKALEAINQTLVTYPDFGRLVLSVYQTGQFIRAANRGMRKVLDGRPVCFNETPNPRARILANVLGNVFVAEVQPVLAEYNRAMESWQPRLQQSYLALSGDTSEAFYRRYLVPGEGVFQEYKEALAEHAGLWTELLSQCGLRPGNR